MKGISAVVATYQRKEELRRLFDSFLLTPTENLEVIVVDQNRNGLLDDLIDAYRSVLTLKHLKLSEANQSRARNLGAAQASYDIVCFPDDDCWFDPGAMADVQNHFDANPDTELLIINWAQAPRRVETSQPLSRNEVFSFRSVGYVTYVQFYRIEAFRKLGGFLEDVGIGRFIGGGEDSELTFRALQHDMRVYYEAGIRVNHYYIPVRTRAHHIIRARQRGMGMVYATYDIPYHVILRGMLAPLIKMVLSLNRKRSGEYYNMFRGRLEGFIYTLRMRRKQQALKPAHL
jgi:glycosyltransferase involved in cell wall biosynthesis